MIEEERNKGRQVHFSSLMDICHLKNSELEPQYQKYRGRVVLRGDIVKDGSGSYAVFADQGSSAPQMTAAKDRHYSKITRMRRTRSRRSICLYPSNNGRRTNVIKKFQNWNVQTFEFVYQSTNGLNHGPVWKTQLFLLNEICTVILWQHYHGKGNSRKFYWNTVEEKF